jgi:DNA repair exonuclease SbcCD nuclease subunit
MLRFLHTADWQLGLKLAFVEGDGGALARGARFDVVRTLAKLAKERDVDAVIVAGDVFDDNAVGGESLQRARDALATFAPIPVLLLPGNHDAATADSVFHKLDAGPHVRALLDRTPASIEGGVFYPCPLMRRHERDDPTRDLPMRSKADAIRVAVAHGGVHKFSESEDTHNLIDWKAVLEKGFDYLALGDWHGLNEIDPRVWYPSAPEATRFVEKNAGNALIVEIDAPGSTPRVEVVHVARTKWITREEVIESDAHVELIESWFASLPEKSWTLVDLTLSGHVSFGARAQLDRLLEREAESLMLLRVHTGALHDKPSEDDLRTLDAEGFLAKAAARLRTIESKAAEDAMRVLHRYVVEAKSE